VLDLLLGGLIAPDAVPLIAEGRQGRCLEAKQLRHFGPQASWRLDGCAGQLGVMAGPSVGVVFALFDQSMGVFAGDHFGQGGEAKAVTVFHRRRLEATVVRRARDDGVLYPVEDGLLLRARTLIEIVRQMPGEPPP
jgi:hypothetical protein